MTPVCARPWPGCCARAAWAARPLKAPLDAVLREAGHAPAGACPLFRLIEVADGMALFERLVERGLHQVLPVIFLTGHGDVPTAVSMVKRGAFDFCEKPFSDNALVDRVEQALAQSDAIVQAQLARERLRQRLAELTERERAVMQLVVEGLPNKRIADQLDISVRTVEVHRARVFDKMAVKSAVELANLLRDA